MSPNYISKILRRIINFCRTRSCAGVLGQDFEVSVKFASKFPYTDLQKYVQTFFVIKYVGTDIEPILLVTMSKHSSSLSHLLLFTVSCLFQRS